MSDALTAVRPDAGKNSSTSGRKGCSTKFDTVARIGSAKIQYGPMNDRIYVMSWNKADPDKVLPGLQDLAERENLGKIIAKVPASMASRLASEGYRREAEIPGYYDKDEDAVFMGHYLDKLRSKPENREKLDRVLKLAGNKADDDAVTEDDGSTEDERLSKLKLHDITEKDAMQVADVYRRVFDTYPFPIHDPTYILETMQTHVKYFGFFKKEKLVALSSAEMDKPRNAVEMTDFATLPEWRGLGLASLLLEKMETAMREIKMKTAFTIARGPSAGINIVFARQGYEFGGRLVNNTNISGNIESMNVWHKQLD